MTTLSPIGKNLAILGVAQAATEEMLLMHLRGRSLEQMQRSLRSGVYWPDFVSLAKTDQCPSDWLPGALGSVVLGWAKNDPDFIVQEAALARATAFTTPPPPDATQRASKNGWRLRRNTRRRCVRQP
jgi:hypothetical protein